MSADGSTEERFRTFDELRYSLRSVRQYVPYVRKIFIVTDRQVPPWLDSGHGQIEIVDHRDIFDDLSDLPTFNSHAIESQLHHIDGLAEHYLYVNDDVFFGRLSDWHTYFERSGHSKFFESKAGFEAGEPSPFGTSVDNAGKNLQRELFRETGWAPSKKLKHTPHPQQRSLMFEIEKRFGDAYIATKRARFRSTTDISFAAALHHRYGQTLGRAWPGSIRYQYLNLAEHNLVDRLEILLGTPFDTLCLNDGAMDAHTFPAAQASVREFLAARFPYRAPWEVDRES
ncbi:MAG: stealth conserved region 3 domain-containing protein [Ilumatobacter sp.]|uniref:stealth conserved region 3 domain-containing protein n=1 Tax=Ilumatobacter sp. TaxID=1967498 RepID=UPI0032980BCE